MKTKDTLKIVKNETHPEVKNLLEALIKMANDGKLKNIVVIAEMFEDDPYLMHAGKRDALKTLGLMDWAQNKWREDNFYGYSADPEETDPSG